MTVTVVIPTRDRRRLLAQTLRSVLGQEGVEVAVVVVDEGSSDGTGDYLRSLGDPRVSVVRHDTPRGLPVARNAGLASARTEWVAFVDDDDLWAPGKLAAQLAAGRDRPDSGWSCVGALWVDERLRPIAAQRAPEAGSILPRLVSANCIPGGGSGVLVHTELLREVGGFRADLPACEDWECWIRLAERSALASVDLPLLAYRVAPGSMSRDPARMEGALRTVETLHAGLASRLGVTPSVAPNERYLAGLEARAGRGRAAAARLAGLARRTRRPRDLAVALAVLTAPRTTVALRGLYTTRVRHRGWVAAGERWLAEVGGPGPA